MENEHLYRLYLEYVKADISERSIIIRRLRENPDFKPLKIAFEGSSQILKTESNIEEFFITSLFCICIEGFVQDPRDSIAILALLANSAEERGISTNSVIGSFLNLFENGVKQYLQLWVERKDKSIEKFGFSEIRDQNRVLEGYDTNGISFNH